MRRTVAAVAGTVFGLVVLLGFKSHTVARTTPVAIAPVQGTSGSTAPSGGSGTGSSSGGTATGTKTVTGDSVDTRWGPVQVQVTLTNGKITKVTVLYAPQNNQRDIEINSYALPILQQESVAASSANIDAVSGATYTSQGYIGSLQSALDRAR